MPSGRPSGTLFSAQSLLWVSLPSFFALPGRVEAENWSPRGPKGVSEGLRKSFQIDSKSLSVSIGGLRRAGGYPPARPKCICMHIYACFYACSCIFVHEFMRIHAYSCIFMHISCMCHAYVCIFMHIYVYLCICLIQGKYIILIYS